MQMNLKFMEFDKLTKCQHITLGLRGPSKNEPRISWINPIAYFLWKNLTGKVGNTRIRNGSKMIFSNFKHLKSVYFSCGLYVLEIRLWHRHLLTNIKTSKSESQNNYEQDDINLFLRWWFLLLQQEVFQNCLQNWIVQKHFFCA